MSVGAKQYASMRVETGLEDATPHHLTQMLFEGALQRLVRLQAVMQHGDVAAKVKLMEESLNIIGGLQISLDLEVGGELARNLFDLYGYMTNRLVQANASGDSELVAEVAALLREIKSAWDSIPMELHHQGGKGTPTTTSP